MGNLFQILPKVPLKVNNKYTQYNEQHTGNSTYMQMLTTIDCSI